MWLQLTQFTWIVQYKLLCSCTNVDCQIAFYIILSFMQNALAVGETQEIKENAELTTLKLRVSSSLCLSKSPCTLYSQHANNLLDFGTKRVSSRSEVKGLKVAEGSESNH